MHNSRGSDGKSQVPLLLLSMHNSRDSDGKSQVHRATSTKAHLLKRIRLQALFDSRWKSSANNVGMWGGNLLHAALTTHIFIPSSDQKRDSNGNSHADTIASMMGIHFHSRDVCYRKPRESDGESHADNMSIHFQEETGAIASQRPKHDTSWVLQEKCCCSRQCTTEETPTSRAKSVVLLPQKHIWRESDCKRYHMQATHQRMRLLARLQGKCRCCSHQCTTEETPTARAKYVVLSLPQISHASQSTRLLGYCAAHVKSQLKRARQHNQSRRQVTTLHN